MQTYVLIGQTQHGTAVACIHSSNEVRRKVIITIIVYLDSKIANDRELTTLYTVSNTNDNTFKFKHATVQTYVLFVQGQHDPRSMNIIVCM